MTVPILRVITEEKRKGGKKKKHGKKKDKKYPRRGKREGIFSVAAGCTVLHCEISEISHAKTNTAKLFSIDFKYTFS